MSFQNPGKNQIDKLIIKLPKMVNTKQKGLLIEERKYCNEYFLKIKEVLFDKLYKQGIACINLQL